MTETSTKTYQELEQDYWSMKGALQLVMKDLDNEMPPEIVVRFIKAILKEDQHENI